MQKQDNFTPTSKRFNFIDRYQKAYNDTGIYYQFGRQDGKKAVQFFYNGELVATRFKTQKYRTSAFDILAYGGQDMNSAQSQREICMQTIIGRYFHSLGYQVEIEPILGDFTPDMLITKGDFKLYIELKAFSRINICGDPEIVQTMKYFEKASRMYESAEDGSETNVPRSILLTPADIIAKHNSYLSHPDKSPEKFVKKFYKKRILPRKYVNTMDKFTSKMMNIHAPKKFKRNSKIGFRKMHVLFPQDVKLNDLPDLFFESSKYDVLLLDFDLIYKLLKRENFSKEAHYFKLIRQTKLEKLVLNRDILEINYKDLI